VHLLACMDHATRAVLAQQQVGGAPEEVPAFAPLLAPLDLAGVMVTADPLQTHPEAAHHLGISLGSKPTSRQNDGALGLAHEPRRHAYS
jgi:hypothetical protein